MARATAFAGRVVTFGESPRADVRATAVEDRGVDGIAADGRDAGRRRCTCRSRCPGAATCPTPWPPRPWASSWACRSRRSPTRLATLAPAEHRGAVLRTPAGATVLDDSYNSSPAALHALARRAGGEPAVRPPHRRARRDARTGRSEPWRCTRRAGAPPPRPGSNGSSRSAVTPAAPAGVGRCRRRTAGRRRDPRRHQRRGRRPGRRRRRAPAIWCW